MKIFLRHCLLPVLILCSYTSFSQDTTSVSDEDAPSRPRKQKGFQAGFFTGAYYANKYTSSLYDGYGLDANGNKNDFTHSAMYNQIVIINGGYYPSQPDRIALALGVQHGQWFFDDPQYMPINLKYNIAFLVGVNLRYSFNKQSSLILNASTSKLIVNGDFTIRTTAPSSSGNSQPDQFRTFSLVGGEQRLLTQLGYQRIMGEDDKLNFFFEGGANITMAKVTKNQINVGGLIMDLTYVYSYPGYTGLRSKYLQGVGLGAFAGLGMNINVGSKWLIQFVYQPTYEMVKLGSDPKRTLNHAFGVRGYYTF